MKNYSRNVYSQRKLKSFKNDNKNIWNTIKKWPTKKEVGYRFQRRILIDTKTESSRELMAERSDEVIF